MAEDTHKNAQHAAGCCGGPGTEYSMSRWKHHLGNTPCELQDQILHAAADVLPPFASFPGDTGLLTGGRGGVKESNTTFEPTANPRWSLVTLTVEECHAQRRNLPLAPARPPPPRLTSS